MEKPEYLELGGPARLFPVLADTSKEGRATSIFLACLTHVDELAQTLLPTVGRPVGKNAKVDAFTEISFKGDKESRQLRPDGLIRVRIGNKEWRALVEAKVGNVELRQEQIEDYIKVARQNQVDAVITISNQFATHPADHPVKVSPRTLNKTSLYHWSWMHLLTAADLLLMNDGVADGTQRALLNELQRFLAHESTGVKGFDRMPREWAEVVAMVRSQGALNPKSNEVQAVIQAWHQEVRDLSLIMSRQVGVNAVVRLSRAHRASAAQRAKEDSDILAKQRCLGAEIDIPDAAGPVEVKVDLLGRSICASMELRAPGDRQSTRARLNWLLNQLKSVEGDGYHIRVKWPGKGGPMSWSLAKVREDPGSVADARKGVAAYAFEVSLVRMTGSRFDKPVQFIKDLETIVPDFYKTVGQNLRRWQAPAPRVRGDRSEPDEVTPAALEADAEAEAMAAQQTA